MDPNKRDSHEVNYGDVINRILSQSGRVMDRNMDLRDQLRRCQCGECDAAVLRDTEIRELLTVILNLRRDGENRGNDG